MCPVIIGQFDTIKKLIKKNYKLNFYQIDKVCKYRGEITSNMDCDVVIVGGGPAGCAAAYTLSGRGLSVTMIERLGSEAFDRYHRICGAGVSSAAVKDFNLKNEEILNRIDTLRVKWPGGNTIDMKIDGYVIDRPGFLGRLREESVSKGLTVVKGSVDHVIMMGEFVNVMMKDFSVIRCRYVIGADGAHSVVRKCCFGTKPQIMLPVEEWHSGKAAQDGIFSFEISHDYEGYYRWEFPYGPGRCTGSVKGHAVPELEGTRGIRVIPMGWVEQFVKKNVLLAGDAAGFANPMTAGGLRTALMSGKEAAEAILRNDPLSYDKWWRQSRMSDRRFMKVHEFISTSSDSELEEFSRHMTHRGLWTNGVHSVLCKPGKAWAYIGCLQALKFGW